MLRAPEAGDATELCAYYARNAERFAPWEPPRSRDVAEHERWIAACDAEARRTGYGTAFLAFERERPDRLTAVVTLDGFTTEHPPGAMIAYSVDGESEGRGLASEAVREVTRHAFGALRLQMLSAYYHPENARSERLLLRLGFTVLARVPSAPGLEALVRPQVLAILRASTHAVCRDTL